MPPTEEEEALAAEAEAAAEGEGYEDEENEPADFGENRTAKGEEVDSEYPLGVLVTGEGAERKLVAACAVAESSDGSVIVTFPGKCWNRVAAKRIIGLELVRKVSAVRAKVASVEDRARALESDLRQGFVWGSSLLRARRLLTLSETLLQRLRSTSVSAPLSSPSFSLTRVPLQSLPGAVLFLTAESGVQEEARAA